MNVLKVTFGLATLLAASAPAYGATIQTKFQPGSPGNPVPTDIPVFQTFGANRPDSSAFDPNAPLEPAANANLANSGSPTQSVSDGALVSYYSSPTVPGEAVGPIPLDGSYISIRSGSYTVGFSGVQVISFVYAALDTYNSVTLNFASNTSTTFSGAQIATGMLGTAINDGAFIAGSGRVTYDLGGTDILRSIVFSTTSPAFEIDGLASAAPEPGTWALMILGFGIVGSALRRRRTQVRFNFA